jgi:rsbT co-antagonist protein RsbR
MTQITGVGSPISEILSRDEQLFLGEWMQNVHASTRKSGSIPEADLRQQCSKFFSLFRSGLDDVGATDPNDPRWKDLREFLAEVSKSRAVQGFTPTETATFVLSFKEPLFRRLREDVKDSKIVSDQIWGASELLDAFGLYTTEVFLKNPRGNHSTGAGGHA